MKRLFSLQEANQALPLVRSIVAEWLERRAERRQLARSRQDLETAVTPEGLRTELADLDARIWRHDEAMADCLRELQGLGITVLRTQPLTLHFPGKSPRGEVVFCWQEGEGSVCFGHPAGEEEHHRRPLRVARGA
jgi:hypothetical protein